MKQTGLNKLLYDRRLELGLSFREACIRLDISKRKLHAIESGYIRVKNKKLQKQFILRYELDENFFDKDVLGYPSSLEDDVEEVEDSKVKKIFKSIWFKIGTIILSLGFVAMTVVGLNNQYTSLAAPCFSTNYYNAAKYVEENGTKRLPIDSKTSEMLATSFKTISYDVPESSDGVFFYESLNFLVGTFDGTLYDEYLGYAFFNCAGEIDLKDATGLDLGNAYIWYESRMTETGERLHFYAYDQDSLFKSQIAHFSVDFNYKTLKFTYNLMQLRGMSGFLEKVETDSIYTNIYKSVFEEYFPIFELSKQEFMEAKSDVLGYTNIVDFNNDQSNGLSEYNRQTGRDVALVSCGIIFATVFFALFIYSLIITTKFGKKVYDAVSIESEDIIGDGSVSKTKKTRELPKNNFPTPLVPEALIRFVAFILMVLGSLSLYFIFKSIIDFDIEGTLESLSFRAEVASFTVLGMMLIFFVKLDIIQNKKSTFILNYSLFFAGFVFYVFSLLIDELFAISPALNRFSIILDFLPGNIVWGILAFNLLTSILLRRPKFKKNEKRNTIIYRCSAILPLGYMIGSSVVQIGKKLWGWDLPHAVSSLFFTKALIITAFTILYCLVIYIYKRIVELKFGSENAKVYEYGNRYQYIKNLLVALVFVGLGLFDMFAEKNPSLAKMGFGSNYIGLFCVLPLILLYHPHRGTRNKKMDLLFNVGYGFSLMIGILLIVSSISIYITSL